jgi:hypothetical protein
MRRPTPSTEGQEGWYSLCPLRRHRRRRGLLQREVAVCLGWSPRAEQYGKMERGVCGMSNRVLIIIADLFKVSAIALKMEYEIWLAMRPSGRTPPS